MKKSRKIFGAVALSAVLAFGTAVPAFADNNTNMTSGDVANTTNVASVNENSAGGTTTVNIATYSSHYDVTLPLVLPFMLDQQGGDGVAPTGYYIQNNGKDAAVEVWNVSWEMNNDTANAGNRSAAGYYYTFGSVATLGNTTGKTLFNSGSGTPEYGSFTIKAASADASHKDASFDTLAKISAGVIGAQHNELGGTAMKDGAFYNYKEFTDGGWTIAKATTQTTADATGRTEYTRDNIDLTISGTKLGSGSSVKEDTIESVAKLVYTIGPKRA